MISLAKEPYWIKEWILFQGLVDVIHKLIIDMFIYI